MITIPTLTELQASIRADLQAAFNATITPEGKAVLEAFVITQAGKLKQFYLAIAALQANVAPDTCDEETLIRFGLVKLGRQPFPAVAGRYSVTVTGEVGAIIPAGTLFKSDDDSQSPGQLYRLDTEHEMSSTSATITLRALTAGEDGALAIGDTLTATAPIVEVDSEATVTAETVEPLDGETVDEYRTAVLEAYRLEAQGGAGTDYRLWASDAQGVAKVYPYAADEPSQVNLYVEATAGASTDGKGTPSQAILDAVEEVINFDPDTSLDDDERGRRPLQVIVNYLPATPKTVVITISSYQNLDSDTEEDNLTALTDMLAAMRPFVASADSQEDRNDTLDNNKIIAALITAKPGASFGSVSFTVDGVSYSSYMFVNGNIPYLNTSIVYN